MRDPITGQFKKLLHVWTPDIWDEGWIDNRGRFRVYRPDYPRAYSGGYALRAHVVWWLRTGEPHPEGTSLHHINQIKTDDRFENLTFINHGQHSAFHNSKPDVILTCTHCGKQYEIKAWRITQRRKEGYGPKYCSLKCYYAHNKSERLKLKLSNSMKKAWAEGRHG